MDDGVMRTAAAGAMRHPRRFSNMDGARRVESNDHRTTRRRTTRLLAIALSLALPGANAAAPAEVPSFKSGEYQVTTTVAGNETMTDKFCLTDYGDWFGNLQQDFKKRGCELVPDGHAGAVYRYSASCDSGLAGRLEVTKLNESSFTSVTELELPIGGFKQVVSTRDRATRIGDCPKE